MSKPSLVEVRGKTEGFLLSTVIFEYLFCSLRAKGQDNGKQELQLPCLPQPLSLQGEALSQNQVAPICK